MCLGNLSTISNMNKNTMLNCNDTCNNKTKELHIVLNHKLNEFHMLANAINCALLSFHLSLRNYWEYKTGLSLSFWSPIASFSTPIEKHWSLCGWSLSKPGNFIHNIKKNQAYSDLQELHDSYMTALKIHDRHSVTEIKLLTLTELQIAWVQYRSSSLVQLACRSSHSV